LSQAQEHACAASWLTIQSIDSTLYNTCFNAAYYYALMVNGYGIPQDKPIHMAPKGSEWTIGAILMKYAQ
jgi:apyrase